MNWFECDNSGKVLFNISNILKILQNNSVPTITQNQSNILSAIQNIASSSGIPEEQLNQILTAMPSDTLINNQNNMLSTLELMNTNTSETKTDTDGLKKMLDIINGKIEDSVIGTLKAGETSITLTSDDITEGMDLDVYTSIYGVNPLSVNINNGSVTLTFKEQIEDMGVKVTFKRDINWDNLSSITIDDVKVVGELNLKTLIIDLSVPTLPYKFYDGSAVVLNNEIHILGGGDDVDIDNRNKHYKYDGSTWTSVNTLPYQFYNGSAVVYNNEIHILGSDDNGTKHYKYDGSTWTSVSTLPYNFYLGSAVIYNNEIHILGGNSNKTNHYKYDGSTWTSVSTLPYEFCWSSAVVYNNEIHILGAVNNSTKHYKYDGSTWTSVSTLPYPFYWSSAVVYNNEIHILGGGDSSSGNRTKHYIVATPVYKRIQ